MLMMMILSYTIFAFLDLKTSYDSLDKKKLIVYFVLMAISCAIGTASWYVDDMPSPAEPLKQMVFMVMGK